MENEQLSDLARAVLGYERITASTDVSKGAISSTNTVSVPKGAVPITEGAQMVCDSADNLPKGAVHVNFSDEKNK